MKLLLMGTGEFARPAFAALVDGHHQVVGAEKQGIAGEDDGVGLLGRGLPHDFAIGAIDRTHRSMEFF